MNRTVAPTQKFRRHGTFTTLALLAAMTACALPEEGDIDPGSVDVAHQALSGMNASGENLGGANLGGANLGGANLGGANLGGTNLGGTNLSGTNLGGTNLGGNNLGGTNLGGTNLGGTNLGGTNLGGTNLGGTNLGGTNLSGTNLGGTNLGGNNLGGTNLGGTNLGGTNTAFNIHSLSSAKGMLYSGEDLWLPKTGQCIVMGFGSTAFPKFLNQQTANAKISVALGKLPWGFAASAGAPVALDAWEAVTFGDKTYCSFVMAAPKGTSWSGIAGFIKAVFRWNAPPTQSMDISGIEASAPYDPTLSTSITTYTGMMNAAAKWKAGQVTDKVFMAGELAFSSATTNNQSVMVDFASWVQDKDKNSLVLGNVTTSSPPNYTDSVYIALDNGDGTVQVIIGDTAFAVTAGYMPLPSTMNNSYAELNAAYNTFKGGQGPRPIPRRCGGALDLAKIDPTAEVPFGKCDAGLTWDGSCYQGSWNWSEVTGQGSSTSPNTYMQLSQPGGVYKRSPIVNGVCGAFKTVLSETYVHLWGKNYDLNRAFGGTATGTGTALTTENAAKAFDSKYTAGNFSKWATLGNPNTSGTPVSLMYKFSTGYAVNSYNVVSGDDNPDRDPRDWKLQGCGGSCSLTSDSGWTTLDTRTAQTFANRLQTNTYSFANSTKYTQIRFRIDGTNGIENMTQVTELQLFDSGTCTPETDAALCSRYGKTCGSFSAVDNCNATRTVNSCGSCGSGATCAGGGTANVCGSGAPVASCSRAYNRSDCRSYDRGDRVSAGGRNWTCANRDCDQCDDNSNCAPGVSGCRYGAVWQDNGPCH